MPTNVDIPVLGESVREAVLIKWHKADGDTVAKDEPLCELETDKANVDVPSPAAGVFRKVKDEGQTVLIGETVARIDESGANTGNGSAVAARPVLATAASAPAADLSPSVRRIVEENKLDPAAIAATGPGGRITKEDALKHMEEPASDPIPVAEKPAPRARQAACGIARNTRPRKSPLRLH